jgi:4-diphosphocytidyl-2-C-methyl-D-erythritol kinase
MEPLATLASMLSERQGEGVRIRTPAKVNLFLEVLGKRPDGYHEIATLMIGVSWFDTLRFAADPVGDVVLHCNHASLSTGPDNLICRAARLLRERTGCVQGASIHLEKRIPLAAGLAGGSSDAAATLAGLNQLWRLGLAAGELAAMGAELGSDIPFFFALPAAWCTGRGEKVARVSPKGPFWFVLACPPVGLSTADVYRGVAIPEQPRSGDELRRAVEAGNVEEVGGGLFNRLQPVAEKLCPSVAELCGRLQGLRPAGVLMSGSGTSVFALCRDHGEAQRVAQGLSGGPPDDPNPRVTIVQSCV